MLGSRCIGFNPPVFYADHAASVSRDIRIVGNKNDRVSGFVKLIEERKNILARRAVEVPGRLIC